MQDLYEIVGRVLGVDRLESDFAEDGSVVANGEKVVAALCHVLEESLAVLLIAAAVVADKHPTTRFQPFVKVGKKRLLVANVQKGVTAVNDVKRLVRVNRLGNVGDLEANLCNDDDDDRRKVNSINVRLKMPVSEVK